MIDRHLIYFIHIYFDHRVVNMKAFHAHIYFQQKDLELAGSLAEQARRINLFESVKVHRQPVGPHPTSMIELHFNRTSYAAVLKWLKAHHHAFSVLIHHDTGDDFKDHTDGILWLGKKLSLDFTFFDLIQMRPDLRMDREDKRT